MWRKVEVTGFVWLWDDKPWGIKVISYLKVWYRVEAVLTSQLRMLQDKAHKVLQEKCCLGIKKITKTSLKYC